MANQGDLNRDDLARLIRTSYDRTADRYAELFARELDAKPFDRTLLARFADLVSSGGVVCDVGCGPGHVGRYLRTLGAHVCGLDLSPQMCVRAARAEGQRRYAAGDMLAMPFDTASLAGIIAFSSVIHLLRPDAPQAFREFARVLQPGGWVLCAVHGGEGHVYVEEVFDRPVPMYATLFTLEALTDFARGAGLTIAEAVERPPSPAEYPTPRLYLLGHRD